MIENCSIKIITNSSKKPDFLHTILKEVTTHFKRKYRTIIKFPSKKKKQNLWLRGFNMVFESQNKPKWLISATYKNHSKLLKSHKNPKQSPASHRLIKCLIQTGKI